VHLIGSSYICSLVKLNQNEMCTCQRSKNSGLISRQKLQFVFWSLTQTDTLTGRTPNPDCCIFLSEVKTRLLCLLLYVRIHSAYTHAWATLHSTRLSALVCLQILDRGRLLADRTFNLIIPKWKPNQI
jgi:hypothetical protein